MRGSKGCVTMAAAVGAALALAAAGCGGKEKPVIPRAAFTMRETERHAIEGRDSTVARASWPEFVGARTSAALDSLRATVNELLVAPAPGRGAPAASPAALLDGFVSEWNEHRKATGSRDYWKLDRRIAVLAETLGVISLAATDRADTGGVAPAQRTRILQLGADDGRRIAFEDLFGAAARDSVRAVLERMHAGLTAAGRSGR